MYKMDSLNRIIFKKKKFVFLIFFALKFNLSDCGIYNDPPMSLLNQRESFKENRRRLE